MERPASTTPGSVMPRYPHLAMDRVDTTEVGAKMRALRRVGTPYTDGEIESAAASIESQAQAIAAEVESQQGPPGLVDKEITALTAYLQRLGSDIKWKKPAFAPAIVPAVTMAPAGAEAGASARPASAAASPAPASAAATARQAGQVK
jgi:uncharacterized protein with LGFP repeats